MSDEKTTKFTVSMPAEVAAAIAAQVAITPSETRSGWLTAVAVRELKSLGAFGGTVHASIIATAQELGEDEAQQILDRALARKKSKRAA